MGDPAKGGAVRGPGQVKVHGGRDLRRLDVVAQPAQEPQELVLAQDIQEHQDVCLFGQPIVVGAVPFSFENQVQPFDVAVGAAVVIPVQFPQGAVPVELADDAAVVEGNEHAPAQERPGVDFRARDPQPCPEFLHVETLH